MELRTTAGRAHENLQLIKDVLDECVGTGYVLLDNHMGSNYLTCCHESGGKNHLIFSVIPASWLDDLRMRDKLKATTVAFVEALVDVGIAQRSCSTGKVSTSRPKLEIAALYAVH